jgi:hypothetical protein
VSGHRLRVGVTPSISSPAGPDADRVVDLFGDDGLNGEISMVRCEKNRNEGDLLVFREHVPFDRASFAYGRRVAYYHSEYSRVLHARGELPPSYSCSGSATGNLVTTTLVPPAVAHAFIVGEPVVFRAAAGALPGGIEPLRAYYVVAATATTFQISETRGGAVLDLTSDGTAGFTVTSDFRQPLFSGRIAEINRTSDGRAVEYLCRSLFDDLNFQVTNNPRLEPNPDPNRLFPRRVYNPDPDDPDFDERALADHRADVVAIGEDLELSHLYELTPILGPFYVAGGTHDLFPASFRISTDWYAGRAPRPGKLVFDGPFKEAVVVLVKSVSPTMQLWQHTFDAPFVDEMRVQIDPFDQLSENGLASGFPNRFRVDVDDQQQVLRHGFKESSGQLYTACRLVGRRDETEPAVARFVAEISTYVPPHPNDPAFADRRYAIVRAWDRNLEQYWSCTQAPVSTWTGTSVNGGGPNQPFIQIGSLAWQPLWWSGGRVKVEFNVFKTPPIVGPPTVWEADVATSFRDTLNLAAGTPAPPAVINGGGPTGWAALQVRNLHRITVTARPPAAGGSAVDVFRTYLVVDTSLPPVSPAAPWKYPPVSLSHVFDSCCDAAYLVQQLLGPSGSPTAQMIPADWDVVRETRIVGGQNVTLDLVSLLSPAYVGASCATPGSAIVNPVQELRFCTKTGGTLSVRFPENVEFSAAALASTDTFVKVGGGAHGLFAGQPVRLYGSVPGGVTLGSRYYVASSGFTATAFKIALARGGNPVNLTVSSPSVSVSAEVHLGYAGQATSTAYSRLGIERELLVYLDAINEESMERGDPATPANPQGFKHPEFVASARNHAKEILEQYKDVRYAGELVLRGLRFDWLVFLTAPPPLPAPAYAAEPCVQACVDLHSGGKVIVERAQHTREVYDFAANQTSVTLSTDRSGTGGAFDRAVADVRQRQKAAALERVVKKMNDRERCLAGARAVGGAVGGGGALGGGLNGPNGGGAFGGRSQNATQFDPSGLQAQIDALNNKVQNGLSAIGSGLAALWSKLEAVQGKQDAEKGPDAPADSAESALSNLNEGSGPTADVPIIDVEALEDVVLGVDARVSAVTYDIQGHPSIMAIVRWDEERPAPDPYVAEFLRNKKQAVKLRGELDPESNTIRPATGTITLDAEADTEVFTKDGGGAHGLVVGEPVRFTDGSGSIPGGITSGAKYYVIADGFSSTEFKVSTTRDGTATPLSGDGSNFTGRHPQQPVFPDNISGNTDPLAQGSYTELTGCIYWPRAIIGDLTRGPGNRLWPPSFNPATHLTWLQYLADPGIHGGPIDPLDWPTPSDAYAPLGIPANTVSINGASLGNGVGYPENLVTGNLGAVFFHPVVGWMIANAVGLYPAIDSGEGLHPDFPLITLDPDRTQTMLREEIAASNPASLLGRVAALTPTTRLLSMERFV